METIAAEDKRKRDIAMKANASVRAKYNNWGVILTDPQFAAICNKKIGGIRAENMHPHLRYKRGPYDQLEEAGKLHARYFIEEYGKILLKKCELPSQTRAFISAVVEHSARDLMRERTQQEMKIILKASLSDGTKTEG